MTVHPMSFDDLSSNDKMGGHNYIEIISKKKAWDGRGTSSSNFSMKCTRYCAYFTEENSQKYFIESS